MCKARWSEREKVRGQNWQLKGRSPVCFRKWRVSSSERANFQPQPSHEQAYGFSPKRRGSCECYCLTHPVPGSAASGHTPLLNLGQN